MRGTADVITETLIQSGVKRVYGLVGDSLNGFTDASRQSASALEWMRVRHEEVAAFAAKAEAHLTGTLVVIAQARSTHDHTVGDESAWLQHILMETKCLLTG